MKAIMVMYDSLRLDLLPSYGCELLEMPNFKRLAEKTATFDNAYVCSLPCMPARKELHTGRPSLLHRSWGPIEPFDDSMPELLSQAGIHTHLSTDHFHYLQDGGATYHERYSTWECFRGQENDHWIGSAEDHGDAFAPCIMDGEHMTGTLRTMRQKGGWQNMVNRGEHETAQDYAQTRTFDSGLRFLKDNAHLDNWFLQIETFDPHEPFDVPKEYDAKWFDPDHSGIADWPSYDRVRQTPEEVDQVRRKYYGLMEFCDHSMGRVLDAMDQYGLWKDTMLIVNTDHGFFLGDHAWWGKGPMPDYQELVHVPFFVWDPRAGVSGVRRSGLTQTIDIAPTLLEYFGQPIPKDMLGKPLREAVAQDAPVHEYAMMGYFSAALTITDGRYKLMRAVRDLSLPVYEYTLMPTHMNRRFSVEEMQTSTLAEPFSFTKGCPTVRVVPGRTMYEGKLTEDLLFDLREDPNETTPIQNPQVHARLLEAMRREFQKQDAPAEQYVRYGLQNAAEERK